MIIDKLDKNTINLISAQMSQDLVKHPLFMFFCSDMNKRSAFIQDYFKYYLPEWLKNDVVIMNEEGTALVVLSDPYEFEYKFKGLNAYKMKKYSFASTVFVHRENLETICEILLPEHEQSLVMTVYAGTLASQKDVLNLVTQAREYAQTNGIMLAYDTFSRRMIQPIEQLGFTVAYSKQFLNTRFLETVMICNK